MIYIGIALIMVCLATYFDLKNRVIPREITLGGLGLGLALRFLDSGIHSNPLSFVTVLFSVLTTFVLVYFLWRIGVLAGGDAKLLTALAAYLPVFPSSTFHIFYRLSFVPIIYNGIMAFTPFLLVYSFVLGDGFRKLTRIAQKAIGLSFLSFSSFSFFSWPLSIIVFLVLSYLPYKALIFLVPAILAGLRFGFGGLIYQFLLFFLLSSFYELTVGSISLFVKTKKVNELKEGDVLYDVVIDCKIVKRDLFNIIKAITQGIAPLSRGLSKGEIAKLKKCGIDTVRIQQSFPFTPVILAGFIICVTFGDLIYLLLNSYF